MPVAVGSLIAGMMVTKEIADWFPAYTGSNSFTEGAIRQGTDRILYVKEVRELRTATDWNLVDINFTFTQDSTPEKFNIITGICYTDCWGDGTGAKGKIVQGGINKNYLVFNFKGQSGWGGMGARGCHSKLVIFGR